jgi:hypothetical protein
MMRKTFLVLISLGLAALAYAALDDITTGSEASFVLEWSIVAIAALWFSALGVSSFRPRHPEL